MGNKWNDQWWSLVKSQQKKGGSAMANDTTIAERVRVLEAHEAYIDSIVAIGQMLCGDDVTDDPAAFPTWQSLAKRQARELRRYAQFLDDCAEGRVTGPIVFPSWRDS